MSLTVHSVSVVSPQTAAAPRMAGEQMALVDVNLAAAVAPAPPRLDPALADA